MLCRAFLLLSSWSTRQLIALSILASLLTYVQHNYGWHFAISHAITILPFLIIFTQARSQLHERFRVLWPNITYITRLTAALRGGTRSTDATVSR